MRVFRTGEAHQLRDLPKVLKFIAGFRRRNRPLIERLRKEHGPDVPVKWIHSRRDLDRLLAQLD